MSLFAELSILVGIATGVSLLMKFLRQPLIIGHIITGLLVGPFVLGLMHSVETFTLFSEIGIAILLFSVGLNLSPQIVREFGKVSLITGIGQVLFTSLAGYGICIWLGFNPLTSFYLGVALAFSSTIIILKLIADKGDMETLYAKIAVGFLLVQDLVAILLLFGIPLVSAGESSLTQIGTMFLRAAGMTLAILLGAHYIMPRFNRHISSSHEMLFLFAIAWGMGIAALFKNFGFSIESGALLAGVALSSLPSRHEIIARLTPLRDFFIILFFILLGAQMGLSGLGAMLPTAIILSILVLVGNPIILMILMGLLGYRKRTSLMTGFTVAQISEFSLILVAMGVKYGHVSPATLSLVTLVGLMTIFGSTYLILYSDKIYRFLEPFLYIFERKNAREKRLAKTSPAIILFGSNRIGHDFVQSFRKLKQDFLVVDHNPEAIELLEKMGVQSEYGDATDFDFLESLNFTKTELVISTIPDAGANMLINKAVKRRNKKTAVLVVAHKVGDALGHYDEGVDYVILPHFLGGKHAAELVSELKGNRKKYSTLRRNHLKYLQLRIALQHDHPQIK